MTTSAWDQAKISVEKDGKSVTLKGELFEKVHGDWSPRVFNGQRIFLSPISETKPLDKVEGVAGMSIGLFTKFIESLHRSEWSGVISVDTGYGAKRLHLNRGELVFAGSNLIDDRLGEVIYRKAQISLDELTQSAAQVTKTRKFGQVLLASSSMSQVELWTALSSQVIEILRSIFLVDSVFVEIQEGHGLSSSELTLPHSTYDLVLRAASYGTVFRGFLGRLSENTEVQLLWTLEAIQENFPPGTFLGDMIALIGQFPNVQQLIDRSKLMDLYTVATLFDLSCKGVIRFVPELEEIHPRGASYHKVRARLDAYSFVLGTVKKAFSEANKEFPVDILKEFVAQPHIQILNTLSIEKSGEINREAVFGMIEQVEAEPGRYLWIDRQIESMIQFLLQVTGDSLNFSLASKIRQEYRSVSN